MEGARKAAGTALTALGIGLFAAIAGGLVVALIGQVMCGPAPDPNLYDEGCMLPLAGLFFAPLIGVVAAICAAVALSNRSRLWPAVCAGSAFLVVIIAPFVYYAGRGQSG